MSKSIVAVLLAALALTACDKPNYPEPLHDWAALVSWDEAGGQFLIKGRPSEVVQAWDFTRNPADVDLANATSRFVAGQGLLVSGVAPDPSVRIPLNLRGSDASLVVVRLTRVKATGDWDGALYYATARHGESPKFMNFPVHADTPPPIGAPVVLIYDMDELSVGGDDWMKSTIERIRLDLDIEAGGEVIIHQVALVREPM